MNRFDNEKLIIEYFQGIKTKYAIFYNDNFRTGSLYYSVHSKKRWGKWVDSSGKNDIPPDFYNKNKKIMMDVMRVDDHSYIDSKGKVVNPTNERESKIIDKIASQTPKIRELVKKGKVFIIPDSGLRGEKDHNYKYYVDGFRRVINNHLSKIKEYKKNHPGYKIAFFVFDESSPYIKCFDDYRATSPDEKIFAQPHIWWQDGNMLEVFKETELDYLIWFTPYKIFQHEGHYYQPLISVYNVKKIKYDTLIYYNNKEMDSLEK